MLCVRVLYVRLLYALVPCMYVIRTIVLDSCCLPVLQRAVLVRRWCPASSLVRRLVTMACTGVGGDNCAITYMYERYYNYRDNALPGVDCIAV